MISNIVPGQKVLVLWSSANPPTNIESIVQTLRNQTGSEGRVQVEHVDIIQNCKLTLQLFLLGNFMSISKHRRKGRSYIVDMIEICCPGLFFLKPNASIVQVYAMPLPNVCQ